MFVGNNRNIRGQLAGHAERTANHCRAGVIGHPAGKFADPAHNACVDTGTEGVSKRMVWHQGSDVIRVALDLADIATCDNNRDR